MDAASADSPAAGLGLETWPDIAALLARETPVEPVYCLYPRACLAEAGAFLRGFPGRVLYAVKANDHPALLRLLHRAGVRDFDCASLPEIERVHALCPGATCYFMVPVRLRGTAREAFSRLGVRHFMIDHVDGIEQLEREVDFRASVVFVRMAVSHDAAMQDLSSKFGAPPAEVPGLLGAVAARGAEPALAFNVGSGVTRTEAYEYAIGKAREVLSRVPFRVRLLDIGGGFPRSYPGFQVPPLADYFAAIRTAAASLPLAERGEILAEPGRALSAGGLSALTQVLLRKDDRLYLNDGMYGIFWELRFKGHKRYPVRVFREGRPHAGAVQAFELYGPTCDATDVLPERVELPVDVRAGDHLEFGRIGAYSLAGRTRFNGFWSDRIVCFDSPAAEPPR